MAKIIGGVVATPLKADNELSIGSEKPVQNKAAAKAIKALENSQYNLGVRVGDIEEKMPTIAAADNGKVLTVDSNGKIVAVAVKDSAVKTYVDEYISSALEGEY